MPAVDRLLCDVAAARQMADVDTFTNHPHYCSTPGDAWEQVYEPVPAWKGHTAGRAVGYGSRTKGRK
jgi:hypothetical protein